MSNRLLPHAVTYYRRRENEGGFERRMLYPVRVCEEVLECDGVILHRADLFILSDERITPLPEFQIGDYFVRGKCELDEPSEAARAYRVNHMLPRMDYNLLKLIHLEGMTAGGVSDGL